MSGLPPSLMRRDVLPFALVLAGLDPAEAASRLAAEGPNALAHGGRRSVLRIALGVVREPMLLLLLLGGGAYLLLGSLREALILLAFATFSNAVTVIQETRTEHVLEAHDLQADESLLTGESLDEPFAGVDLLSVLDIKVMVRDLKRRNIGVLITDHNVHEMVELVDRAYVIYRGRMLFEGTPAALIADRQVRQLYLGEDYKA